MTTPTFNVTVTGERELVQHLREIGPKVRAALYRKMLRLAFELITHIRKDKLSGQVLNHRTGRLWRSLFHQVVRNDNDAVVVRVATSKDVPYAAIHEFGGTTRAHEIVARRARALRFEVGGETRFAKRVRHPGSKMPERSYLRSSLGEYKPKIESGIREAVVEGLRNARAPGRVT